MSAMRTALVTGAGSGIGRALARELARRGHRVTVADIDLPGARETAALIGDAARAVALDVRDAEAFAACVDGIVAEHGRLDLLVNNAGIPISGEVQDLSLGHWDRIIDVNLRGVVHGVAAAYPGMRARGGGTVVNVASLAGLSLGPLGVPYAATKHAVVGLSLGLRAEAEAYGVRVSVLCPGTIDTPILDRANPDDLAAVPWRPDNRSYVARLCGAPMPVDRFAARALDAVEKDRGVIVLPGFARFAWWTQRYAPWITRAWVRRVLAQERASTAPQPLPSFQTERSGDPDSTRDARSRPVVGSGFSLTRAPE